jgi:RNA-directed DNA polymerase
MSNTEPNTTVEWNSVNWRKLEKTVFKLQKRIFRASQSGNSKKVRRLQKTLARSWSAKMLAVRKISQDNRGKKTAGVDGVKSLTPKQRIALVSKLRLTGKAKPTRRVWIPKPGIKEKRPLGIPTMFDRALQALVKMTIEPEWEARFETNSYGFRPGRSAHDAIEAIYQSIGKKDKYVLDADIAKCFDKINHEALLRKINTYPSLRKQIRAWLKCGVLDEGFNATEEGTPQGAVISPLLANIALHGMEERVKLYAETFKGYKRDNRQALSLIRYADDFVILHKDIDVIRKCQKILSQWLAEIGLELKPSKTRITHTLNRIGDEPPGFDFLGFNIRQYKVGKYQTGTTSQGKPLGFKTLIRPSKKSIKNHHQALKKVVQLHKVSTQPALIDDLNPKIWGWAHYFSGVVSKECFSALDQLLYFQLVKWAVRRHPNKNKSWVASKYWHRVGTRNWVFAHQYNQQIRETLLNHADMPIVRHIKVKGEASPFDGKLIYWSIRKGKHPELPLRIAKLLKRQKGKCTHCGLMFRDGDVMEIDHIIPKSIGGKDVYDNLQLLHRHCHDVKSAYDRGFVNEEPDEVKISSPVLKTSGSRERIA